MNDSKKCCKFLFFIITLKSSFINVLHSEDQKGVLGSKNNMSEGVGYSLQASEKSIEIKLFK